MDLYGRRNSTNVVPVLWGLEELGLRYRRKDLGGSFGGLDTPEFLALNPNGRIPVLDDDGFVVWESNSIVRYLFDVYGEGALGSKDCRQRARSDQWMEWYKTTFYGPFIALYQMFVRTDPDSRDPARVQELAQTVGELLRVPDAELRRRSFLSGDHFGMGDIPLGSALYRYVSLPTPRPSLEGIDRWYARLRERSPYRSCVMRPFGLTPSEFKRLEREGAEPPTGQG